MNENQTPPRVRLSRVGILTALASTYCLIAASYVFADSGSKYFDIPAQNLQSALNEFARQSDRQILFSTDIARVKRSNGITGEFEPEAALRQLLQGTGLTFRVTADETILAEVAGSAASSAGDGAKQAQADAKVSRTTSVIGAALPLGSQETAKSTQHSNREGGSQVNLQEVIVTGTLIRGITPAGTNVISLSSEEIAATGAVSTGQLLASIPQMAGFMNFDTLPENTQITVKRPNIRNLPGVGTSGGSTTLVLLDGHRMVGGGVTQTAPDPDVVPPSMLERVEVIPDGGSATYGADAVGGVINFITRRRFDGFQASARYGFADNYHTFDASGTAGRDWGSGSAFASYSYAEHGDLFGRDRDYARHYGPTGGPAADLTCNPGNLTVRRDLTETNYAIPGLAPNTSNTCDTSENENFYPQEKLHSVFAGLSQDFSPSIKLDIRGFYSQRRNENTDGPFFSNGVTITSANPFYSRTTDNPAPQPGLPQAVTFSWEPVFGNAADKENTRLEAWGVAPALSIDVGHGWQVRGLANFGGSITTAQNPLLNNTLINQALAGTTTQTAINPYNIAATLNPQLLANIANYQYYGQGRQELINYRAITDGKLFSLKGGEVRLAVGLEYIRESYAARNGDVIPGAEHTLVLHGASRTNKSGFVELFIPIVGAANATSAVHSLTFSASARYDDYSDFGNTSNPKFALTYQPLHWIAFRGNWGQSFNAPSLADAAGAQSSVTIFPALTLPSPLPGEFSSSQAFQPLIALQGGAANIQPQTAKTYSVGFDSSPPVAPGLTLSATYYHIDFSNLIGIPPVFNTTDFYTNYTDYRIFNPTLQQVQDATQDIPGAANVIAGINYPAYVLIDARRTNIGNVKLSGIDFAIRYAHDTDFGAVDASFTGTYELQRESQALDGLPWIDLTESDLSRFRSVITLGANIRKLRAQAQWNHSQGFNTTASAIQTHVDSFNVINVYCSYDLGAELSGSALLKNLQLTLYANNVFDTHPPLFRGTYRLGPNGYANGSTVGRLIQLGISNKF